MSDVDGVQAHQCCSFIKLQFESGRKLSNFSLQDSMVEYQKGINCLSELQWPTKADVRAQYHYYQRLNVHLHTPKERTVSALAKTSHKIIIYVNVVQLTHNVFVKMGPADGVHNIYWMQI